MRTTLLALALALPLVAADRPLLERAVELFRSDSPQDRDDGSRLARLHVEASLRPLVGALDDADPEVRRRAREAILSVLPDQRDVPPEAAQSSEWWGLGGNAVNLGGGNLVLRRGNFVQIFNNGGIVVDEADQAGQALNQLLGIQGFAAADGALRAQLRLAEGRGFLVTAVDPNARGAKLGLAVHDVVTTIGGRPVQEPHELVSALGEDPDYEALRIGVIREGQAIQLSGRTTPSD